MEPEMNLAGRLAGLSPAKRAWLEARLRNSSPAGGSAKPLVPELVPRVNQVSRPLSFAQERLWFLSQLEPGNPVVHRAACLRLRGALDLRAWQRAFTELLRRHEVLRSVFPATDGSPRQEVTGGGEGDGNRAGGGGEGGAGELECVDLGGMTGQDREAALHAEALRNWRPGFDLARGPIWRARMVRLAAEDHVFLFTVHHIAFDAWSAEILREEMGRLYRAFRETPLSPGTVASAEPELQYADFAAWQRASDGAGHWGPDLEYWKAQLSGPLPVLELAGALPRVGVAGRRGGRLERWVDAGHLGALKRVAEAERATLFMVLTAGFQVLLSRWGAGGEVILGTPVAGRSARGTERLIGCFINTLALRVRVDAALSFRRFLGVVRETVLGGLDHQAVPFEKVVGALNPERSMNQSSVFQAMINLRNVPVMEGGRGAVGLEIDRWEFADGVSPFELVLEPEESADGLLCRWRYDAERFDADTVERLAAAFGVLLAGIGSDPDRSVADQPLLTPEERRQVVEGFNQTAVDFGGAELLHRLVEEQVGRTPGEMALEYEGREMTYAELDRRANQVAQGLRRRGVGPEVFVGVCAGRSLELVVGLLGILKAGGAYVPLDPDYPVERLRFMLEDSEARVVLAQAEHRGWVAREGLEVVLLDPEGTAFADESTEAPQVRMEPGQAAYMIYTSGSTGQPKGVVNTHRGICNTLKCLTAEIPLGAGDVVMQKAPTSFDASVWELFWPLTRGARELLARPGGHRDPVYLADRIARRHVTVIQFVPSMLAAFLELMGDRPLPSLRHVTCGGEALTPELADRFFRWAGETTLHNHYGPTEAAVHVTSWTCRRGSIPARVPIGRPGPNTRIHILDPRGEPVGIGVPGELYIGGVQVGRGYWKRPDLTAAKFVPDRFHRGSDARLLYRTGDSGRWRPDGSIEFHGRLDDQIKIRGFRVELGEIEAVLAEHPAVRQAAVVARDGADGGVGLAAFVVPGGAEAGLGESLRAHLMGRLPEFMIPGAFVAVDALPLGPSGKLDRRALKAGGGRDLRVPTAFRAPRDAVESGVARLWEDVLGGGPVGLDDNFFARGGHSLLAMRVVARLTGEFGVSIPVGWLFAHPTLAGFAEVVREARSGRWARGGEGIGEIRRLEPGEPARLSREQERLWFLHHSLADPATYHVPVVLRLKGVFDPSRFERALGAVIRRHAVLRTAFVVGAAGPRPEVMNAGVMASGVKVPMEDLERAADGTIEEELGRRLREEVCRPFDLGVAPLMRARCFRLGPEEHVLAITVHHLVWDEGSFRVLFQELSAFWMSDGRVDASVPPAPAVEYVDYAVWQTRRLASPAMAPQRAYWRRELADAPGPLEWPVWRRGGGVGGGRVGATGAGTRQRLELDAGYCATLERLGREEEATPFMAWLAAYIGFLHRFTGAMDLLVLIPVSLRTRPELESMLGFFVNTVPVRSRAGPETTFRALVREIRRKVLLSLEHRELPLDEILRGGDWDREAMKDPVRVAFVLGAREEEELCLSGLEVAFQAVPTGTSKFELALFVNRLAHGTLRLGLEYDTGIFGPDDIQGLMARFKRVFEALVGAPDRRWADQPMLGPGERQRWTDEWRGRETTYPREATLPELFAGRVREAPGAAAVVCGDLRMTYATLDRCSRTLARRLRRVGVRPGENVAIHIDRSADYVMAVLAVLRAGATYVPLPMEFPPMRRLQMAREAGASRGLIVGPVPPEWGNVGMAWVDVGALDEAVDEVGDEFDVEVGDPEAEVSAMSPAYVMFTSGSTGRPKGVVVPHRAVIRLVCGTDYLPWGPGERFLMLAPVAFDASTLEMWGPLLHGGTCVIHAGSALELEGLERTIRDEEVTCVWLTAGLFNQIVDTRPSVLGSVRHVLTGGEALSVSHVRRALEALPGVGLINGYGPTESTTFACTHAITGGDCGPGARSIPIGRPIANTRCEVVDGWGQLAGIGMRGELYVGGDGLALGYLNEAEGTAERFVRAGWDGGTEERWYRTGDACRWLEDGTLEFLGRLDEQVKIRGFRVEPGEIESALKEVPGVGEAVVLTREGAAGRELVACVASKPGVVLDGEGLRGALSRRLPEAMIPADFVTIDAWPLTPNGKTDRKRLAALARESRRRSAGGTAAPGSPEEAVLREIWSALLGGVEVGARDDFFALGGSSLLALRMLFEVQQRLGWQLPVSVLLAHPTIEGLVGAAAVQGRPPGWVRGAGQGPPLFFIPGVAGVNYLPKEVLGPVHAAGRYCDGLQFPGVDGGEPPMDTVEGLAAALLVRVREVWPRGPVCFAGYSLGGNVALEMARQMAEAGETVPLVILYDSFVTGSRRRRRPGEAVRAAARHLRRVGWREALRFVGTRVRGKALVRREAIARRLGLVPTASEAGTGAGLGPAELARKQVFDASFRAGAAHRPRPYAGRVVLFRSTERDVAFGVFQEVDAVNGWGELLTGGLEVVDVVGDHWHILEGPGAVTIGIRTAELLASL